MVLFHLHMFIKTTQLWPGKACAFINPHGTEEYVLVTFCVVWFALLQMSLYVHVLYGQVVVLCD